MTKKSSYIQAMSYDAKKKQLFVLFSDGAELRYDAVSSRTYNAIDTADSVGQKFAKLMDGYNFTVLTPAR